MSNKVRLLVLAVALGVLNMALGARQLQAAESTAGWFDHCSWTCFASGSGSCAQACGDSFGSCGGDSCYGNSNCCNQT